ncbi:hypothetical protein EJB05_49409, partial [Eragrostis curvula]
MGEETKTAGKGGDRGDKNKDAGMAAAGPQPIVLKVHLHCLGCARKVHKAIKRAPGVESVATDIAVGKVIVTGSADATELKERIEARTKKPVHIVSAGAGPSKKEKIADKEKGGGDTKKATDMPNKEETLQVQVQCEVCFGRIKRRNSKIKGVMDVVIDADNSTVKVTGTMDAAALPAYLRDKLRRSADVVAPGKDGGKKGKADGGGADKKKDRGGEEKKDKPAVAAAASVSPTPLGDAGMCQMPRQYGYTLFPPASGGPPPNTAFYDNARYSPPSYPYAAHLDAPLTFSDENPNACSVM